MMGGGRYGPWPDEVMGEPLYLRRRRRRRRRSAGRILVAAIVISTAIGLSALLLWPARFTSW